MKENSTEDRDLPESNTNQEGLPVLAEENEAEGEISEEEDDEPITNQELFQLLARRDPGWRCQ